MRSATYDTVYVKPQPGDRPAVAWPPILPSLLLYPASETVKPPEVCDLCDGGGASRLLPGAPCPTCGGAGFVLPDFVRGSRTGKALSGIALDTG